ncbi:MAG: hypothetical protein ACOC2R_03980 [Spirochaetota bacterium]
MEKKFRLCKLNRCGSLLRTRLPAVLLPAVLLLAGSCSGQPPEIAQLFWQLNVVYDTQTSTQYEELTLFVHAEDADGLQDIDQLELLHNQQELLWSFDSARWRTIEREGERWIGTNGVRNSAARILPRGEYRVKLSDKAGEAAETVFNVNSNILGLQKGSLPTGRFPAAEVGARRISLSSTAPELLVSLYDAEGGFIRSELLELKGSAKYTLVIDNWTERWPGARRIMLQHYDAADGFGLVSGPLELPELPAEQ